MAYLLGGIVGGCIIVSLIALGFGRFAFGEKRPASRAGLSTVAAYLTCSLIAGFGMADGAGYTIRGFIVYAIPALIVFGLLFWKYNSAWIEEYPADHFE